MSVIRFRFQGPGIDVSGPVQGSGGLIKSLARLEQQQRLAAKGKPLGVYEPEPGHVCVFPDYTGSEDGRRVNVPIALCEIKLLTSASG